jgi:hypothetical protein
MNRPPHASHHCRHYSYDGGILNGGGPKCASGVDLAAPRATLPCMPDAKEAVACDLREEHTEEERAAWQAWRDERAGRMILIMAEIPGSSRDKKNRPGWGQSGAFPCPACDWGEVRWARARSNGHLRAVCTTKDCFGVIE